MNTTRMPGFTAAVSLYQTSRHYRTGNRATHPTAHPVATIRPAEIDVPGEVIIIEDDSPWWPPPWGGHTGPGPSGGGSGGTGAGEPGGGSGGDGGIPPHADPDESSLHTCTPGELAKPEAKPCQQLRIADLEHGIKHPHYTKCTSVSRGGNVVRKMECCQRVDNKTEYAAVTVAHAEEEEMSATRRPRQPDPPPRPAESPRRRAETSCATDP
jgi:hypothetical protein